MADRTDGNLRDQHADLDRRIRIEAARRVPDEDALAQMKREKLALKDQLTGLA